MHYFLSLANKHDHHRRDLSFRHHTQFYCLLYVSHVMNSVSHTLLSLPQMHGDNLYVVRALMCRTHRHYEAQSGQSMDKSGVQQPIPEVPTCIGMSKDDRDKCRILHQNNVNIDMGIFTDHGSKFNSSIARHLLDEKEHEANFTLG